MFKTVSHGLRRRLIAAYPDELIRIYSLQHPAAAVAAAVRGYWTGDPRFAGDPDEVDGVVYSYLKQFDWMREQMAERIPDYSGDYPIWGTFYSRNMRQERYYPEGVVSIVADVPRHRMVITDYEGWHSPLNNWYCCDTEEEDDRRSATQPEPPNAARVDDEMRETWKKIFNIDWRTDLKTIEWSGQCWVLQACVDRIYPHEIVSQRLTNGRKGRNGGKRWN